MSSAADSARAAAAVDERRLWLRHEEMGRIGATPKGGVNRQALSDEDAAARQLMVRWAQELELSLATDDIGNLFMRLPGSDANAAPVMTGSHLDSQPTGGRFDGSYGVLAGLEVLQAIRISGTSRLHPIEVVAWVNEEGSRFLPGCMGSGVFTSAMRTEELRKVTDWEGVTCGEALDRLLASTPDLPRYAGPKPHAYIETHIEQGPVLETTGKKIGVVSGIQGARHYTVEVLGEEAHAGTTPLLSRRDAMRAAAAMVTQLNGEMSNAGEAVRFTVGRFDVEPGSPNTIPGRVLFSIDFRHPNLETMERLCRRIEPICQENADGCTVTVEQIDHVPPTVFDQTIVNLVERHATSLGYSKMRMPSGAGHDAMYLARLCPTGMIFVPCEHGISHNEAENASPEDLAAGARVLAACLVELAQG